MDREADSSAPPEDAAARVEAVASVLSLPAVDALALLTRGRVLAAAGEDAEPVLVTALTNLRSIDRPLLRVDIHLALARAKRSAAPADAIIHARAALAICERLGARRELERSAAFLRELGVRVRPAATSSTGMTLSTREREVMLLVAQGLSNAEIGARLFLSPKTVEHHVTAVLGKLGLRKRPEVAAWVAARPELVTPDRALGRSPLAPA